MSTFAKKGIIRGALQQFTLDDITKHQKIVDKSLIEQVTGYPSQGLGFRVWRRTWPPNSFWDVKDVKIKTARHGRLYGVLTWKGKPQNEFPIAIAGTAKRGTWNYDISKSHVKLDNGVEYTAEEMNLNRNQAQVARALKVQAERRARRIQWVKEVTSIFRTKQEEAAKIVKEKEQRSEQDTY